MTTNGEFSTHLVHAAMSKRAILEDADEDSRRKAMSGIGVGAALAGTGAGAASLVFSRGAKKIIDTARLAEDNLKGNRAQIIGDYVQGASELASKPVFGKPLAERLSDMSNIWYGPRPQADTHYRRFAKGPAEAARAYIDEAVQRAAEHEGRVMNLNWDHPEVMNKAVKSLEAEKLHSVLAKGIEAGEPVDKLLKTMAEQNPAFKRYGGSLAASSAQHYGHILGKARQLSVAGILAGLGITAAMLPSLLSRRAQSPVAEDKLTKQVDKRKMVARRD